MKSFALEFFIAARFANLAVSLPRYQFASHTFFSPFDNTRYFLPWRPIRVPPIAVTRFFTPQGFAILQTEMLWIWLPAMLLAGLIWMLRRKSQSHVTIPSE
jgi:membrane-bound metal-dependent hydrolase YbcI (DUF457 family)